MKQIIAAVAFAFAALGCTQIDTGNVGVESTFGQVKEGTLTPGVYFSLFKTINEITAKEVAMELKDMKPKTSDNVTLADLDVNIYYKIVPAHAHKIMVQYAGDMAKNGDGDYVLGWNLMGRVAREASYQAISRYNSSDVHTKRSEIAADIQVALKKELGVENFEITNVIVRNLVTDPALEASIKQAAQVEFDIRQRKQAVELAKQEAERLRVEAEGQAKANAILASSITPQLLQLKQIEAMSQFAGKGNSTVILPSNATPLINIK